MNKRSFALLAVIAVFALIGYYAVKILTPDNSQPIITEPMKDLAVPVNRFSLKLFQELSKAETEKNIFFSPVSVMSAMGLAEVGARGDTRYELRKALSIESLDESEVNQAFHDYFANANRQGKAYMLSIANALWVDNSYKLMESFKKTASESFDANIANLDFIGQPESSRNTINSWVSNKTNAKIPELFPSNTITKDTRLAITNAVYFKGDWATAFDAKQTQKANFYPLKGDPKSVDTMSLAHSEDNLLNYYENNDVQIVELPYKGKELSMEIILPKSSKDINTYIKDLTPALLSEYNAQMSQEEVTVELPKFKFTTTYDLIPSFKTLGAKIAFNPGAADFSGIDGNKGLYINVIIHKAYIDVNEEGTEAAAATGVGFGVTALPEQKFKVFQANRPFIFIIKDDVTGTPLFVGKVMDPTQ